MTNSLNRRQDNRNKQNYLLALLLVRNGPPMVRPRRLRGFSWIEVMIAIFVIGFTAGVFALSLPMSSLSQQQASNRQQALGIIQHKIDQLRAVGYGRLTLTELRDAGIIDSTSTSGNFTFNTVDTLTTFYPNPVSTITVTDFSTTVRQVTVRIRWSGAAQRQGNGDVSLIALIAKG